MTLEELLVLFRGNLTEPRVYSPQTRVPRAPRHDASYAYQFYPITKLSTLMDELLLLSDEEGITKYSARYLVTTEGVVYFAREGAPSKFIPGHRDMSLTCLAAGNVYFSEDLSAITKVSHCSGDFQPQVSSMIHVIAALYLMKAPIRMPLQVEISLSSLIGEYEGSELIDLDASHVAPLLPAAFSAHVTEVNRKAEMICRVYEEPKKRSRERFFDESATRRRLVDDMHGAQKSFTFSG